MYAAGFTCRELNCWVFQELLAIVEDRDTLVRANMEVYIQAFLNSGLQNFFVGSEGARDYGQVISKSFGFVTGRGGHFCFSCFFPHFLEGEYRRSFTGRKEFATGLSGEVPLD